MRYPGREIIEKLKQEYPIGTRVILRKMDDCQAPPIGTKGTVQGVDDAASLLVKWDNGCGLNVVYGVDEVENLDSVTTVCYGEEKVWDSRKEAKDRPNSKPERAAERKPEICNEDLAPPPGIHR